MIDIRSELLALHEGNARTFVGDVYKRADAEIATLRAENERLTVENANLWERVKRWEPMAAERSNRP